jgi:hypothetical protein
VADDLVISSQRDLEAALSAMALAHRMVFFAGLPGVGKSLFIREMASAAHAIGRAVHFLQWDVVRPSFESQANLERYPERDGVTHPQVRMAIGQWGREAVLRWHRAHSDSQSILVGEVPLIGNRLIELAQVHADDVEPLLAGPDTLFVTPVPSVPVRAAIERARERTFANPAHPHESADAPPGLLRQIWLDTQALAVEIGAAAPLAGAPATFDPQAYAAVYRHLLRHRNAATVTVNTQLPQRTSVYDLPVEATYLFPTDDEVAGILKRIERDHTAAEVEHHVSRWFQSI